MTIAFSKKINLFGIKSRIMRRDVALAHATAVILLGWYP